MHYTLNQLRIFRMIVEKKSITKAAEALHLTQPAVSIQLRKLQDQFDIPLTEVIGRKIYITDFGYEIANAADRIMDEVSAIKHRAASHQGKLSGRLKLAIVSTAKYVMPFFLSDFLSNNEDVELEMDVTNKAKVIESLAANEVDFALVSVLPEQLQCETETLMENRLYLVGPAGSDIAAHQDIHLLESLPLIFRESGSATRRTMEEFINQQSLQVNIKMELTSNEAVKQAVIAGLGFSIMPLIGIRNELNSGRLKIIEMPGLPLVTSWNLIWLKGKQPAPVASAFLEDLRKNKTAIITKAFPGF
jgi:DNA-binding transcriptional LysR family regulator